MNTRRTTWGFFAGLACVLVIAAIPDFASAIDVEPMVTGTVIDDFRCPPAGYRRQVPGSNPPVWEPTPVQPPLNNDYDGDGTNDSWSTPITLPKAGGGTWPATDEAGNSICVVRIADTRDPGCGHDRFSYRFKPGGAGPGVEIGQCVYACGFNTWTIRFEDADNDGVPDRFLKSVHVSHKGGGAIGWPFAGEITSFVTDLTKNNVVPNRKTRNIRGTGFQFVDATIVPIDGDFGDVALGGQPIGFEYADQPVVDTGVSQTTADATNCAVSLDTPQDEVPPGGLLAAQGLLTNRSEFPHHYEIIFHGVNASVSQPPFGIDLAPGMSAPFSVQAVVNSAAPAAVIAFAYAETGEPIDTAEDAVIVNAGPAAPVPAVSEHGLAAAAMMLAVLGAWFARRRATERQA